MGLPYHAPELCTCNVLLYNLRVFLDFTTILTVETREITKLLRTARIRTVVILS